MLPLATPFVPTWWCCVADPCPDPTTYVTEGGQYCDQATDDDTAAGKPPRPPTAPEEKNRRAYLVLVCPGCPEGCDYMPDTRPDRYRDQDGEVIPPVIEEPDIVPPGSHLPYRVRRTYCTGLESGL